MFSYYGTKTKIVKKYPKPSFDSIIEPFAGAAQYSLLYFEKDVTLYETYERVYNVWRFLQQSSPQDILSLPDIEPKKQMRHEYLSEPENDFISFCGNRGTPTPHKTAGSYANIDKWWVTRRKWVSENLYRIKHWNIILGDGMSAENRTATWFVDPPYQFGGERYVHSKVDFQLLGKWCNERRGEVIVCENEKATWMNFVPLTTQYSQKKKTYEVIYHRVDI